MSVVTANWSTTLRHLVSVIESEFGKRGVEVDNGVKLEMAWHIIKTHETDRAADLEKLSLAAVETFESLAVLIEIFSTGDDGSASRDVIEEACGELEGKELMNTLTWFKNKLF